MSSKLQSRAAKKERKRQEKQRKKERDEAKEQRRLEQAFNQQGELDRGWMKEILNTDDLEQHLDQFELNKVRALINRQWVLANLSEAQTHDRWYKLEVMKYKIYGSFPPDESAIQGPVRAFVYDDEYEKLNSLTAEQRTAIDQIILSLQNMVTRSTDGFERKQINTNIARTEREDGDGDDSGGRLGLF